MIPVAMFEIDENGIIIECDFNFDSSDLEEEVPKVGDFIVEPRVADSLDRKDPANRRVYEVIRRYFLPTDYEDEVNMMALVVRTRSGIEGERLIFGKR